MSVLMVFVPSACRWNHAFKNQITTLQSQAKNRANPNRSEVQANLSLFLEAASGFYTQVRLTDVGLYKTSLCLQTMCLILRYLIIEYLTAVIRYLLMYLSDFLNQLTVIND